MFLKVEDKGAKDVWPVSLKDGSRLHLVTAADTDTGFYEYLVIDSHGKFVLNKEKTAILRKTAVIPEGIIFTKSRVNEFGG